MYSILKGILALLSTIGILNGTGDLGRRRKDSFYWYQKVLQSNGRDLS